MRYSHVAKLARSSNRFSCRNARMNVSCTTSSASSGFPVMRYASRYTPRECRSTSTRKASSSPPFAFATAAASSECICFIRRGHGGPVRSPLSTTIDVDDRNAVCPHAILPQMLKRQTSGSVVCASCGYLVGVNDERCYNCGRRNPGLWGYAGAIKQLGNDLGFTPLVITICIVMFAVTLLMSHGSVGMNGIFNFLSPHPYALVQAGASGQIPIAMGRFWTVFSAMWLHGSLMHIFF